MGGKGKYWGVAMVGMVGVRGYIGLNYCIQADTESKIKREQISRPISSLM